MKQDTDTLETRYFPVMKAILFDLDGTLLDIDIDAFLSKYFAKLSSVIAVIANDDGHRDQILRAIHEATGAMMRPHEPLTNREVFVQEFGSRTGLDLTTLWPVFDRFYAEDFLALGDGFGPAEGAIGALTAARKCGLKIAVATNPIFPRIAIEHRMSWAGITPEDVDVITDFETMVACKPHAAYFRQTAEMLGVSPHDCLMVGDDAVLDLAAADIGMKTFFVGDASRVWADYYGSLADLAEFILRSY